MPMRGIDRALLECLSFGNGNACSVLTARSKQKTEQLAKECIQCALVLSAKWTVQHDRTWMTAQLLLSRFVHTWCHFAEPLGKGMSFKHCVSATCIYNQRAFGILDNTHEHV